MSTRLNNLDRTLPKSVPACSGKARTRARAGARVRPALRRWALGAGLALATVAPALHASDFLDECLVAVATYAVLPIAWIHGDDADAWPARREPSADTGPTVGPGQDAPRPDPDATAQSEPHVEVAMAVEPPAVATAKAEPLHLLIDAARPLLLREWVHGSQPLGDEAIADPLPEAAPPTSDFAVVARDRQSSMTSEEFDGDVVAKSLAPLISLDWLHAAGPSLPEIIEAAAAEAPVLVAAADASCAPLLQQTFNLLQTGEPQSLCRYQGKVLLIVNTASYCGYTKQYQALEALYRNNKDRGLVVIGFPSNDFGGQEPGTNKEVAEFCRTTYGVEFPMYEKSSVTAAAGTLAGNALYAALAKQTGKTPQWNFHKYVVDRSGTPVASFGSAVTPDDQELVKVLERLLKETPAPAKS